MTNTKKLTSAIIITAALMTLQGCTIVAPSPDEVAVLIDRPLFVGEGGIRPETRPGGTLTYTWFSTKKVYVSMKPQVLEIPINDYVTKDNALLDYSSVMRYEVTDAIRMIQLGDNWLSNIVLPEYNEAIRREVVKHTMQDALSNLEVIGDIDTNSTNSISRVIQEQKIPIRLIAINLGLAKPQEDVAREMNKTVSERQRNLTMIEANNTEKSRLASEQSRAEADNAYRNQMSMSADQFTELEKAKLLVEACKVAKECVLVPPGTPLVR